jgi:hydroxypyruvate isomerase
MARFAANLSFLFTELPVLDRFAAAAQAGFRAVEFMFPYDWPATEIRSRLETHGLALALFNLPPGEWAHGERGLAALAGREAEFEKALGLALHYAAALGCSRLHAMAGLTAHGAKRATFARNLRAAARLAAPLGIEVLIEPINTRDVPGYFLTRTAQARDVIAEVDEPNVGLQLDLYHRHVAEGDVEAAIAEFAPLVRHYQVASPPDRGEPDRGELDYRRLFNLIEATGYDGWIGCEYKPRGDTRAGLAWVERCGVRFG